MMAAASQTAGTGCGKLCAASTSARRAAAIVLLGNAWETELRRFAPKSARYARALPISTFQSGRDSATAAKPTPGSIPTAIRSKAASQKRPTIGGTGLLQKRFPHFFTGTFRAPTLEFFPQILSEIFQ